MKIQLLYFPGCPNVDTARESLRRALAACRVDAAIEEVDTTAPDTPEALRTRGSPSVLIDGIDIAGESATDGASCRLDLPSEAAIRAFITRARGPGS